MNGTNADLNQTVVFVEVVRAGSFSEAARQLEMPKSTVSRRVSDLEHRLGARLLQRTTRKLSLTETGRIYYERTAGIVRELKDADQTVGRIQDHPQGLLRVTAPLGFGLLGPTSVVTEYLERHPDVQLELVCTDRNIDIVDEGFDVAIRLGHLPDSTLIARKLGTEKSVLVAAPKYTRRRGTPRQPQDLREHSCISFGIGTLRSKWVLQSDKHHEEVAISPTLTTNDLAAIRAAVMDGLGCAWLPLRSCVADIRAKRLRHLLKAWTSPEVPVHALYPTRRHLSPNVVAFIDLLTRQLDC